jgi:predicted nuclease with RNAse H fold
MREIHVLGIDLAGPLNKAHTVAAGFCARKEALEYRFDQGDLGDRQIRALIEAEFPADAQLVIGLDAPLSYNPEGGDRPADSALRRRLIAAGLPAGTVMAPTMSRMVYLTLRGVILARSLTALRSDCRLVEVHPAGAMALRGAPAADIRKLKKTKAARRSLLDWLAAQGLAGLPPSVADDHTLAAYAAALAAWDWSRGRACWAHPALPPEHPYDFAC